MNKKAILVLIFISCLFLCLWYFEYIQNMFTNTTFLKKFQSMNQNIYTVSNNNSFGESEISETRNVTNFVEEVSSSDILTSYSNAFSAVPVKMEPILGGKHIIFFETRCVLEETESPRPGLSLTKRQACAVESAAKMNPDYNIYVLYTCPINGKLEDTSTHERAMFLYPNIKLWKVNITTHLFDTPLANWDFFKKISSSKWPIEHSSDVLRMVSLWKYGGIYLDMDVVLLKSLSDLGTNYIVLQDAVEFGNSVMSFAPESLGHEMAKNYVDEIRNNFRGDIWNHNGADVLTRVFLKLCKVSKISEMSTEKCNGFKILSNKEFFAIPWRAWELFFDEDESENVMNKIKDSYGVHMWNYLTKTRNVTVGSIQPYNLIAEKSCPWVHSVAGKYF